MRMFVRVLLGGVFVCLLLIAGGAGLAYYLNQPTGDASQLDQFRIETGESLSSIGDRLEGGGFIRSAELLALISRYRGTERRFQRGAYQLSGGMSTIEIHDYLTSGNQVLATVTIPEGFTARRIGALLEERGITPADEFQAAITNRGLLDRLGVLSDTAEGLLYPDTYRFPADYPAEAVVEHLVDRFFDVVAAIEPEYRAMNWKQFYDAVILASIVEREYRSPWEAPTIASVFYNRLDEDMRLESCATVVYVMTEELGLPHPSRLFYRDLERESPYNTYRHSGLPPGPIANPGRVALDAAFHPARTNYRFFVLRGAGAAEHHFSYSLSEHNEAALLYLKTP